MQRKKDNSIYVTRIFITMSTASRLDSTLHQINPHCSFIYYLQYILMLLMFQAPEDTQAGHV